MNISNGVSGTFRVHPGSRGTSGLKKGARRAHKRFSEQNAERNKDSIWLNGRTAERTDFQERPLLFFFFFVLLSECKRAGNKLCMFYAWRQLHFPF